MKGLNCPKCKKDGKCYYRDIGETEYYDEYTFYCEHCGHNEQIKEYGESPVS
jgi:hypothetical protein